MKGEKVNQAGRIAYRIIEYSPKDEFDWLAPVCGAFINFLP